MRENLENNVYDGDNIFAEFDGNNRLLGRYTHSQLSPDDVLEAEITNAGVSSGLAQNDGKYFYLKDVLGSVTDKSNENGQIVQRYDYESFGKIRSIKTAGGSDITSSPIVNTSFTYTGREWDDEAGLYYYRARYYDANVGRFIQQDLHPGLYYLPITLINKYIYSGNNPAINTDPTGKWFFVAMLVGALVGGVDAALNGEDFLAGAFKGAVAGLLIYFTWNLAATTSWFGILSGPQKWAGFISSISGSISGAASSGGSFVGNLINRILRGHTVIGAAVSQLEYAIDVNMVRVPWTTFAEKIAYPVMISFGYILAQIPKKNLEEDFRK